MSPVDESAVLIAVATTGQRDVEACVTALRGEMPGARMLVVWNHAQQIPPLALPDDVVALHEPTRGYASARNAAIRWAFDQDVDHLVFFDDDQRPFRGWASHLLDAAYSSQADVVVGPVVASLPPGAWARPADIRPSEWAPSGPFEGDVHSGNTLVKLSAVRDSGVLFDTAYDAIGGEDTAFFRDLRRAGAMVYFCGEAVAVETVDPDRVSLPGRWREGTRLGRRTATLFSPRPAVVARRVARLVLGLLRLLGGCLLLSRARVGRGAFDVGYAGSCLVHSLRRAR